MVRKPRLSRPEAIRRRRFSRLLDALGHPERRFPIAAITGTNGKGSVGALLDAALGSAGLKVGLFSSPHIESVTERFRIEGRDLSPSSLERASRLRGGVLVAGSFYLAGEVAALLGDDPPAGA
jgi:folylpolyglutamate synthase/dihydropteroate synthase